MASAKEYICEVLVAILLLSLPTCVRMMKSSCECCSDIVDALENIQQRLKLLDIHVSSARSLEHRVMMLELKLPGDIRDLQDTVNAMQNKGQNVVSNLVQTIPGTSLDEVHKKIQEGENKIRRIQEDLSEIKQERTRMREDVEKVKRSLPQDRVQTNQTITAIHAEAKLLADALTPEVRQMMASLPRTLDKIERLDKVGHRVMKLFSAQQESYKHAEQQNNIFQSKNAANSSTPITANNASGALSTEQRSGEENYDGEWKGYPLQSQKVSNHSSKFLHNKSVRNVKSVLSANETYNSGYASHSFLNDASLNHSAFDGIREIEFVGSNGNFSIMMNESDLIGCTEYSTSNKSGLATFSGPCNLSGDDLYKSDEWNSEELPIEHAIHVIAQQLLNLQNNVKDAEWEERVSQLEDYKVLMNSNISQLHTLLSSRIAMNTNALSEAQLLIANMSEAVNDTLLKFRHWVLTELDGRPLEDPHNTSSVWATLESALSRIEATEHRLATSGFSEAYYSRINDTLSSLRTELLALNESVRNTAAKEFMELDSQFRNLSQWLEAPVSNFDQRIQEFLSVTRELKESLNNVTEWLEVVSRDVTDNVIAGDIKLQRGTDELKGLFTAEVEKLKENMQNVTKSITPWIQGWHPDDNAGCPGVEVLAADEHLVLGIEHVGRFRAPNLPSTPLPTGTVVRFHCVPAGTHRLIGTRELRCLRGGRWSSPPPICESLPTIQQMLANGSSQAVPSITHDGLFDEEWVSADDEGRLVVRPGSRLRLKCLYPRHKGTVSWRHNETFPRDATFQWIQNETFHGYQMEIGSLSPDHTGTYSCETKDGKRHFISIKIADVTCEKPKHPLNGQAEMAFSGPIAVGENVRFNCDMGYNLSGSEEITCLGSGGWSSPAPTCEENEKFIPPEGACQRLQVPESLIIKPDRQWYDSGFEVEYSCKSGRMLTGMSRSTCYEGEWLGRLPSCM